MSMGAATATGVRATAGALVLFLGLPAARSEAQTAPHTSEGHEMMEWGWEGFLLSEVLDYAPADDNRPIRYDLLGWVGGPWNRLWAKAEGVQSTSSGEGDTELQLLYGRLISPFWDLQAGVRMDIGYGDTSSEARASAALGLQGLAPGWFEVEPTLFVSQAGDVAASFEASYDLLLTQRLVAQPRLETSVAIQSVPEFGVGSGINGVELGLRLRYEIWRELAPYVGVSWDRRLMETADLARAAGEPAGEVSFVLGLRLWL